jgi:hypothetical protein
MLWQMHGANGTLHLTSQASDFSTPGWLCMDRQQSTNTLERNFPQGGQAFWHHATTAPQLMEYSLGSSAQILNEH